MKADKELLMMAAKACGFGKELGFVWTKTEWPRDCGIEGALWDCTGHGSTANLWNPLNDDGDALRLAVKLKINIGSATTKKRWARTPEHGKFFESCAELRGNADPYAATRRAIVRAAAAIGEKL